ncbi:CGNR zinc finger domain-containing protein [Halomonadaceae bacterium KBTZ08]
MVKAALQSRPLEGEPIALDLVNTQWNERGQRMDLLEMEGGVAQWLSEHDVPQPADLDATQAALCEARAALRRCLEADDGDAGARAALNQVLAWGRIIPELASTGPSERIEAEETLFPAWVAARGYLELRNKWSPKRIRACAHPDCILYFLDATRSGTRRWCDMQTCGNRAKAKRYHNRYG